MNKIKPFLLLIYVSSLNLNAQKTTGILGKMNLIGVETDIGGIVYGKSYFNNKILYERLIGRKTNIGVSLSMSKYKTEYYRNYNYQEDTIKYIYDNKNYFVVEVYPRNPKLYVYTKVYGFDFNIKRYFIQKKFRNTGTFINYKFGMNFGKAVVPKNSNLDIGNTIYTYDKTVTFTSDIVQEFNTKYIGIDLGNSFTIFNPRLYMNMSLGFAYNFGKFKERTKTFDERIKNYSFYELALSQLLMFNLSLSYAL